MKTKSSSEIMTFVNENLRNILSNKERQGCLGFFRLEPQVENISRKAFDMLQDEGYTDSWKYTQNEMVQKFQEVFYSKYVFDPNLAINLLEKKDLKSEVSQRILIYNIFRHIQSEQEPDKIAWKERFRQLLSSDRLSKNSKQEIKRLLKEIR